MRYQDVRNGTMKEKYPQPMKAAQFDELAAFLRTADRVCTMRESQDLATDRVVAIRHDVDHNLEHAVKFARWEHKHGFKSSYYVLPSAWYWGAQDVVGLCTDLELMGHEVGLHNNCVAMQRATYGQQEVDGMALPAGFCLAAAALMTEQLAFLRGAGIDVKGTAAHGDYRLREWGINNQAIWAAGFRPEDFALEYEAYHLHRWATYVSDNRGVWRAPLEYVEGKQTHLLIHPCHWDVDSVL